MYTNYIKQWAVSTIVILIAAYLLPGVDTSILGAIVFAVVLGIVNLFIAPFVLLLTLPITILTLGLFALVINALMVWLAASIVPDFSVDGFLSALLFSIIVSLIYALFVSNDRS